jgi:creatinine amidohydrolase/Fe(II)-dependent formamide hydrolase-like protein
MVGKAAEGYNDFYFADDHLGNVRAVEKVMDLVDVKSKVQQAKIKFSKDVDQIFNDIIENKTGILSAKEYSAAKAKTVVAKKGRWKFWIAPSAEDFVGLLYPL